MAEQCVQYVQRSLGMTLDYAPETLPVLDHYLRLAPHESDDVRVLLAATAGAYFGEVVRANHACRWSAPEADYGAWRIEFESIFLHFNPVAFAHEAVIGAEIVHGGSGFGVLDEDLGAVRSALDTLGTIDEADYFLLSTRYEVLVTVVERLMTFSAGSGASPVPRYFGADAYRAALGDGSVERPS